MNCPTCNIPIRTKLLDDGRWAAWCPKGTTFCGFRRSRIFRPTEAEAIAAWMDPAVNASVNKLPRPRDPNKPRRKHVMVEKDNFPRCWCGLRIYDGGQDCGGFHLTIHDYIRSGEPAPGACNLR